jgi:hypothetical protein
VEVEPDPKFDSLGESHSPPTWLLPIVDCQQFHCMYVDKNVEPYSNAWASLVQKMKVHEKDPHAKIDSSSNPMDPLQGGLLPKVWIVPTWEFAEALTLAPHLDVLPSHLHVNNPLNLCLNM